MPLMAPADSCCNCGSTDKVKMTDTDLRRMPAMGLAGAEIKIVLPFPYCKECVPSAKRRRPGALGILAINSLITAVLAMCWIFYGPLVSEETMIYVVCPASFLLSLILVFGFYGMRRPSGSQTSYYQPVKLKNTGHKWPADITGLELAFTNKPYANSFTNANKDAVSSNALKVSNA